MRASSALAFMQDEQVATNWHTVSALKSEVDRLVGCDLGAAAHLSTRIEELAAITGDQIAIAFAEASRARVFHHAGEYARANAFYEKAASAMRGARLITEAAGIQKHQVDALTQMGRYDDAFRTARAVRRVLRASEPVQAAQLETNVG